MEQISRKTNSSRRNSDPPPTRNALLKKLPNVYLRKYYSIAWLGSFEARFQVPGAGCSRARVAAMEVLLCFRPLKRGIWLNSVNLSAGIVGAQYGESGLHTLLSEHVHQRLSNFALASISDGHYG